MAIKLNNIKPNQNNPRIIKDDKFAKLVKSLTEFPEMMAKRPLVCVTDVDGKMYPLGGNMRLKALQELKYKEIPDDWVIMVDEWPEEKRKEFVIKDNVGFGEWDWDELANDWDAEQLTDWGLDIPNFEVAQEAVEDDFNGVPPKEPITVLGDLYELNEHRLHCADSCDSDAVAKLMNGKKADMVFTDPPYGVSYTGGLKNGKDGLEGNAREMIKNDDIDLYEDAVTIASIYCAGPVFMFYADTVPFGLYRGIENVGGEVVALLIWEKPGGYGALGASYKANHEPCVLWKLKNNRLNFIGSTTETRIWREKKEGLNKLHPTQKPIEIPARAIGNHKADIVLDLFFGSGSTLIASDQLNRICYGQELDPKYCDVIVARYIKYRKETGSSLIIKRNGQQLSEDEINKYIENTENKQ